MRTSTSDVWNRIEAWLAENVPEIRKDLNPGASDEALASLRDTVGSQLPEGARDVYRVHDGQSRDAAPLLGDWAFLPLVEVASTWGQQQRILDDIDEHDDGIRADKPVRQTWWSSGWLPVFDNGAGDFYCVDVAPAEAGTEGQVISFWHADNRRTVIAPDLPSFFEFFASVLG